MVSTTSAATHKIWIGNAGQRRNLCNRSGRAQSWVVFCVGADTVVGDGRSEKNGLKQTKSCIKQSKTIILRQGIFPLKLCTVLCSPCAVTPQTPRYGPHRAFCRPIASSQPTPTKHKTTQPTNTIYTSGTNFPPCTCAYAALLQALAKMTRWSKAKLGGSEHSGRMRTKGRACAHAGYSAHSCAVQSGINVPSLAFHTPSSGGGWRWATGTTPGYSPMVDVKHQ